MGQTVFKSQTSQYFPVTNFTIFWWSTSFNIPFLARTYFFNALTRKHFIKHTNQTIKVLRASSMDYYFKETKVYLLEILVIRATMRNAKI